MFTQISRVALLATVGLLAACGEGGSLANGENDAAAGVVKVECALAGSADFKRVCSTETISGDRGKMLVIRHPDGGFRRFDILTDGRGLAPSDGFDETSIKILSGGMIEVKSADDSYRLPADIKGSEKK